MLRDVIGKRVLLLQGPNGPFFMRFAADLRQRGCTVTKVNFNSGDDLFNLAGMNLRKSHRGECAAFPPDRPAGGPASEAGAASPRREKRDSVQEHTHHTAVVEEPKTITALIPEANALEGPAVWTSRLRFDRSWTRC